MSSTCLRDISPSIFIGEDEDMNAYFMDTGEKGTRRMLRVQRNFMDDSPRGLPEESGVGGNDELAEEIFGGDNLMDPNHAHDENGMNTISNHRATPQLFEEMEQPNNEEESPSSLLPPLDVSLDLEFDARNHNLLERPSGVHSFTDGA